MSWVGRWSERSGPDGKREVVLTGRLKPALLRLNPDLPMEANWKIDKLRWSTGLVLFAPEPNRKCDRLKIKEFFFKWKTSEAVSPLGETGHSNKIHSCKSMQAVFSRSRENDKNVKMRLSFTKNIVFTTT